MFIPFAYTKNSITKTNWEGKGVKPNIVCKSKDTLKIPVFFLYVAVTFSNVIIDIRIFF